MYLPAKEIHARPLRKPAQKALLQPIFAQVCRQPGKARPSEHRECLGRQVRAAQRTARACGSEAVASRRRAGGGRRLRSKAPGARAARGDQQRPSPGMRSAVLRAEGGSRACAPRADGKPTVGACDARRKQCIIMHNIRAVLSPGPKAHRQREGMHGARQRGGYMKRFFKLIALAAVVALAIVACGKPTAPGAMKAAGKSLTIGLVLVGPYNDQGWSQANYDAVQYVVSKVPGHQDGLHRQGQLVGQAGDHGFPACREPHDPGRQADRLQLGRLGRRGCQVRDRAQGHLRHHDARAARYGRTARPTRTCRTWSTSWAAWNTAR